MPPGPVSPREGLEVLVVSRDLALRAVLLAGLSRHARAVHSALTGNEALEQFQTYHPDVTFVDAQVSHCDALTLVKHIRRINAQAAIVMLTGSESADVEDPARAAGVRDFMRTTPPHQLLTALQRLLQKPQPAVEDNPPSVLVVDDEPAICGLLEGFLSERQYRVSTASKATEALQQVEHGRPHVIVLDLNLPDMPGLEVLKQLHAQRYPGRVVVLTGAQDERLLRETLELGAVDVMQKPVDLHRLLLAIDIGLVLSDH